MKLNYLEQLKQSNISINDLIPSTQKKIGELNVLLNGIKSLEEKKEQTDDERLISEYDNKIEEIKEAVEQYDFDITKKITKNDFYKENAKKMKEGRNKQKTDTSTTAKVEIKEAETQSQSQQDTKKQTVAASVVNKDGTTTTLDVVEEKKGIGLGAVIFGAFALIATGFAYNHFVNRE